MMRTPSQAQLKLAFVKFAVLSSVIALAGMSAHFAGLQFIAISLFFISGATFGMLTSLRKIAEVIWAARLHAEQCEKLIAEFRAEQEERAANIGKEKDDTHGDADTVPNSQRELRRGTF
jgi:uncharacterized membrane protein YjgN (DUF898 family)